MTCLISAPCTAGPPGACHERRTPCAEQSAHSTPRAWTGQRNGRSRCQGQAARSQRRAAEAPNPAGMSSHIALPSAGPAVQRRAAHRYRASPKDRRVHAVPALADTRRTREKCL